MRWPANIQAGHLDPQVVTRLGLVAGVLAPLLFVIPFLLGSRYSITRETHMRTRQELDRRRAGDDVAPPTDPAHLDLELAIAPPGVTHL